MESQKQPLLMSTGDEPIVLSSQRGGASRVFCIFLIGCALLVALFAVVAIAMHGNPMGFFQGLFPGISTDEAGPPSVTSPSTTQPPSSEPSPTPEQTPIVEMDLSYLSLGEGYLHNETPYTPNVEALLSAPLPKLTGEGPRVLILHTHTGESYLSEGTTVLDGLPGDLTYSRDAERNVLAVGEELCRVLNARGIETIHCTTLHDDPDLRNAYARSRETVQAYLERYPGIVYVIDLHRDAILTGDGEYVRPLTPDGEGVAQVMAVVGSDCNGTVYDWEQNLALALQLRQRLNQRCPALCRPVSLRRASYHQELAPGYLLLEIGSGANTPEQAKRAAALVGETLADLLLDSQNE